MNRETVRIGIIGGGLMGREVASALGRWFALQDVPVHAELTAICDIAEAQREWFRQIPSVRLFTADYHELLKSKDVDVVYVAVPHNLHEKIYLDVIAAGKDLFAEKPFGIDLGAAQKIAAAATAHKRFVRCSSEFPFLPGALRALAYARNENFGRLIEVRSGFLHSSDLDPDKPANWKRQTSTCGEIGVMGDLGMHAVHIPLRLGWKPKRVYAQLQNIHPSRADGKGGRIACDTWDNALLHSEIEVQGNEIPLRIELKRLSPGDTNSWYIELLGTDGGVKFNTREPKTLHIFHRRKEQGWERIDLGSQMDFPTITGSIFEAGFADCFQQMWASFLTERAGKLGNRLGCVTPEEAVFSHKLFSAALVSHKEKRAIDIS